MIFVSKNFNKKDLKVKRNLKLLKYYYFIFVRNLFTCRKYEDSPSKQLLFLERREENRWDIQNNLCLEYCLENLALTLLLSNYSVILVILKLIIFNTFKFLCSYCDC